MVPTDLPALTLSRHSRYRRRVLELQAHSHLHLNLHTTTNVPPLVQRHPCEVGEMIQYASVGHVEPVRTRAMLMSCQTR